MADLNIPNLDKLIAHLEAQPPERINMGWVEVEPHACGTCGCIKGHAYLVFGSWNLSEHIALETKPYYELVIPPGWRKEQDGVRRYPAHRVIATLKRLRDRFLATGEIVVDWGPEPTEGQPWSAPRAVELTPPALPAEITRFLATEREEV
ncbi:hypothetical protein [Methylobacterium brachiatum]|uniref:hypothetical protein n=1 Tax=Methylobacterium brachiatum TaxID=269660 RepID=UPI000EFC3E92|nr:hypothetical protein [Methylobacterium brachiatum]AYO83612.1 hypothetical protein EBB05_15945 [Methylobacterium brachiatum]